MHACIHSDTTQHSTAQHIMGNKNSRLEPHQQQQLDTFWSSLRQETENGGSDHLRSHPIPLNRIRDIMKNANDQDHKMIKISAELPAVMEKACQLFIADLALRSWLRALKNRRQVIQENDINASLNSTYNMAFVSELVYFNKLMSPWPH